MTAHLDLLVTLLHWGAAGWLQVLGQREALYGYLGDKLREAAMQLGERLLLTPGNPISYGLTLDGLAAAAAAATEAGRNAATAAAAETARQGPPAAAVSTDLTSCAAATEAATDAATDGAAVAAGDTCGSCTVLQHSSNTCAAAAAGGAAAQRADVTFFGAMLWAR